VSFRAGAAKFFGGSFARRRAAQFPLASTDLL
jgi:hypothetical protein